MAGCPNCGADVSDLLAFAPVAVCPYCDTTVYHLDDRLVSAGSAGEMHEAPLLVALGDRVRVGNDWFQAVGHARFSYGPGWWDEFWLQGSAGEGAWLSIDEGDVTIQHPTTEPSDAHAEPRLGDLLEHFGTSYAVTEAGEGTCVAMRGVFPERLAVGDTYEYVNATSYDGGLLSSEGRAGDRAWFQGAWLDPFTLEVERA